jgi:hypothetical protein
MARCFVIQPFDKGTFDKRYDDVFEPAIGHSLVTHPSLHLYCNSFHLLSETERFRNSCSPRFIKDA